MLRVLPDPNYKINTAGIQDAAGVAGQEFATIKIGAVGNIEQDRTLTGKLVSRSNQANRWFIDINYNPMTKAQFDPVYNFLMEKRGSLKSFQVSIPQYKSPQDSVWAAYIVANPTTVICSTTHVAGATSIDLTGPAAWITPSYTTGLPKAGDFFTLANTADSLHTKAYRITHVETQNLYQTIPIANGIRIHFTPGLQRRVAFAIYPTFTDPLFTVTQLQDVQEYSLNTENLYSFSLRLEEALY